MSMGQLIILCSVLFFGSFLMTYIIRLAAIRHKIIDLPNSRSSHNVPTPRGGGLAIVLTWFAGISVLYHFKIIEASLYYAFLPGILLATVSLIDDVTSLKPGIRFIVQFFTAVSAFYFLGGLKPVIIGNFEIASPFILYPLSIIGIIWFVNLFNFLDGIDGYSSLEAIFAGAAIAFFTMNLSGIILIACIGGFLVWNWPKAKIFMGDVGSTQLGFILVIIAIYSHNTGNLHILQWIIITSLFWFDATLTLFRRLRNKEKLSEAHRKHAYQRIVSSGLTHQKTIIWSLGINLLIFIIVYSTWKYPHLILPAILVNMILLYCVVKYIDRKAPFI